MSSELELDDELLELATGPDKSRKRVRDGSGKSKSSKKRKVSDSDNEVESEEGEGEEEEELYPLEGKYIDEADREELLGKTEFEREAILATRMDEVERIRDRKHVDKLRAQQLAGVAAVEGEARRPARSTGKDRVKDRSLNALKAKRKAKDEKKRTSPKNANGDRSASEDMDMSDSDSEDGQISRLDENHERVYGKADKSAESPAPEMELTVDTMQKIILSRTALAKHCGSPFFEQIVQGCWVRYLIGEERTGRVYRLCQIKELVPATKPYKLVEKIAHHAFILKHGKAEKIWPMDRASNEPPTNDEYKRVRDTCAADKVPFLTRREVEERYADMQKWINKTVTEDDVSSMIARRREAASQNAHANGNGGGAALSLVERSQLTTRRTLALRRQDMEEVAAIDAQLAQAANHAETDPRAEAEDRLAKVNERNRKANLEAVRRAEIAEAERKRKERRERAQNGNASGVSTPTPKVFDPSARLKTVPRLFESATPNSTRPSTPNPPKIDAGAPPASVLPPPKPQSLVKGQKTFEAAVIESLDVDLGDF